LKEVGKWLAVNGEAVYGTHNWVIDGEGFTPLPPRSAAQRRPGAAAAAAAEQSATAGTAPAAPVAAQAAVPTPVRAEPQGPKPVVYRFTVKGDKLYAIAQSWPGDTAIITSLGSGKALDGNVPAGKIAGVTMLGHSGNLQFTQDAEGLKVKLPADRPCDYAYVFKITGLKMNPAGPPVPAVMADLR
jgi:alpha-L-fucosidase